jgi:sugar phosphate isomerase/epimerase
MRSGIISFFIVFSLSLSIYGQRFDPDFFCFEDAFLLTKKYSFEDQVSLLKGLGFDGIELEGLEGAGEKLGILNRTDFPVYMVYVQIDLEKEEPYSPELFDFIKKVRDRGVTLWLHIHSEKFTPSDPEGDRLSVPIIQKLADYAREYNVKIALYPHSRFWLEKVEDSVRLTEKINRQNVGAVFNLCHFLKTDERNKIEEKLINAIPFLAAVSINGADDGNTNDMDWSRLIKPLGDGTFDVLKILRILRDHNYKGTIGLQCYNIAGEPSEFLARSMKTWDSYIKELSKN